MFHIFTTLHRPQVSISRTASLTRATLGDTSAVLFGLGIDTSGTQALNASAMAYATCIGAHYPLIRYTFNVSRNAPKCVTAVASNITGLGIITGRRQLLGRWGRVKGRGRDGGPAGMRARPEWESQRVGGKESSGKERPG